MKQAHIISYKDIVNSSADDFDPIALEDSIGRKGLGLWNLVKADIPTPNFFLISGTVFKKYVLGLPQREMIGSLDDFRTLILNNYLSKGIINEISTAYRAFTSFGRTWVSVRSSIILPHKLKHISFAGQLTTILNVKGIDNLEKAIKEIYASLFSPGAIMYLKKYNVKYSDLSIAIVVQKMVQAEASGVTYTIDPVTLDKSKIAIEAVFGLGDVIANGEISPDYYVVDKHTAKIIDKKIIPQEWMRVRRVNKDSAIGQTKKLTISKMWQYMQKLDEPQIGELARLCRGISLAHQQDQHIEWILEGGKFWILQSRDFSHTLPLDLRDDDDVRIQEVDEITKLSILERAEDKVAETVSTVLDLPKTLIFLGQGASSGIVTAKAYVIFASEMEHNNEIFQKLKEISEPVIVVTDELANLWEDINSNIKGIITDYGGISSDAAVLARENGIPAIVGSRIATKFIKNEQVISIDGASGAVYNINEQKQAKKALSIIDKVDELPREKIDQQFGDIKTLLEEIEPVADKQNNISKENVDNTNFLTKIFAYKLDDNLNFTNITNGLVLNLTDLILLTGRHLQSFANNKMQKKFVDYIFDYLTTLIEKNPQIKELNFVLDSLTPQQSHQLIGGQKYFDDSIVGSQYYVKHKKEMALIIKLIDRLRELPTQPIIGIVLQSLITNEQVKVMKKIFINNSLRRSSLFKIYFMLDTPGQLPQMPTIIDCQIDGFILDLQKLYERTFQQKISNKNPLQVELISYSMNLIKQNLIDKPDRLMVLIPSVDKGLNYTEIVSLSLASGANVLALPIGGSINMRHIFSEIKSFEQERLVN